MYDTIEKQMSIGDPAMILLIENKYRIFYSHNTAIKDSVVSNTTDTEKFNIIENIGEFSQKYQRGESFKIYKNKVAKMLIFTDKQGLYKFLYKEPLIQQDWKILSDTKELKGYKCQKAICTFRGRDYEAWFTREIPISDGPWKFNGLPGLIVQVYDINEHYKFELYLVHKKKKAITLETEKHTETNRDNYIKTVRRYLSNPLSLFGKGIVTDSDGRVLQMRPRRYDVMDRDIK
jgi:GLPGLI family protein